MWRRRITVTCLTVVNQEEGKTTHAAVEISHRYTCHSIGILRCEMPMKGRVLYGHSIYDTHNMKSKQLFKWDTSRCLVQISEIY